MKRVVSTRLLQGKYKMTEVSALYCELIHNRQEKRATCFAILLQNKLKAMLLVLLPTFKPVLQQIRFAASSANTDF